MDGEIRGKKTGGPSGERGPEAKVGPQAATQSEAPVKIEVAEKAGKGRKAVHAEVKGSQGAQIHRESGITEARLACRAETQGCESRNVPGRENVFRPTADPESVPSVEKARVGDNIALVRVGSGGLFIISGKGEITEDK